MSLNSEFRVNYGFMYSSRVHVLQTESLILYRHFFVADWCGKSTGFNTALCNRLTHGLTDQFGQHNLPLSIFAPSTRSVMKIVMH